MHSPLSNPLPLFLLLLLLPSSSTQTPLSTNLNYASPSRRAAHANLGLDTAHIHARGQKRGAVAFAAADLKFTHGVASGDPFADSVILWTRVAPGGESEQGNVTVSGTVGLYSHETDKYVKADAHPVCVEWRVWEEEGQGEREVCGDGWGKGTGNGSYVAGGPAVAEGRAYTTGDIDYTVKVSCAVSFFLLQCAGE